MVVGRVIFHASRGPVALPVNFRFSNEEVLFNTTVKAAVDLESQTTVGFEIDRIDDVFSEGWSVVVTGSARRVDHPDELVEHAATPSHPVGRRELGEPRSRSPPTEITGRVIIHDGSDHGTQGPGR